MSPGWHLGSNTTLMSTPNNEWMTKISRIPSKLFIIYITYARMHAQTYQHRHAAHPLILLKWSIEHVEWYTILKIAFEHNVNPKWIYCGRHFLIPISRAPLQFVSFSHFYCWGPFIAKIVFFSPSLSLSIVWLMWDSMRARPRSYRKISIIYLLIIIVEELSQQRTSAGHVCVRFFLVFVFVSLVDQYKLDSYIIQMSKQIRLSCVHGRLC